MRLRIATANLENLDDTAELKPPLAVRVPILRAELLRLDADVVCLQEIHSQQDPGGPRDLCALDQVVAGTQYAGFNRVSTHPANAAFYDVRNLAILSRFPIASSRQLMQDLAPAPQYGPVTRVPPAQAATRVRWERPILHAELDLGAPGTLHVVNLHLKSRLPTPIDGQKVDQYTWRTASGWAEGFFLSSLKRVGQALETRFLVDSLFDADADALLAVCGDFNADSEDVPILAIRGDVENTGNAELGPRVLVPCEQTVPEPARYSLYHHGKPNMLDHVLVSRPLLQHYRGTEIHNETLHDESIAFATDTQYPESDHAPVVAEFDLP
jgi:endonuclease/exonuclease/phosphatase family metal-dependent hydrolase